MRNCPQQLFVFGAAVRHLKKLYYATFDGPANGPDEDKKAQAEVSGKVDIPVTRDEVRLHRPLAGMWSSVSTATIFPPMRTTGMTAHPLPTAQWRVSW